MLGWGRLGALGALIGLNGLTSLTRDPHPQLLPTTREPHRSSVLGTESCPEPCRGSSPQARGEVSCVSRNVERDNSLPPLVKPASPPATKQ